MVLIVSPSVIATTLPEKFSARARMANAAKTNMRERRFTLALSADGTSVLYPIRFRAGGHAVAISTLGSSGVFPAELNQSRTLCTRTE
jgi:hypothetical protein